MQTLHDKRLKGMAKMVRVRPPSFFCTGKNCSVVRRRLFRNIPRAKGALKVRKKISSFQNSLVKYVLITVQLLDLNRFIFKMSVAGEI